MKPTEILFLRELETGPATSRDIAAALRMSRGQINRIAFRFHRERLIYVCAWERSRGAPRPVWRLGKHQDAQRLPPLTHAERQARTRANHPETYRRNLASWAAIKRARRRAESGGSNAGA